MPLTLLLLLAARSAARAEAPRAVQGTGVVPVAVPVETSDRPFLAQKKWAICVGAGEYTHLASLKYAAADARLFSKALVDGYGFDPATVAVLTDGAGASPKLPTSAAILGEVQRRLADKSLDKGDLFVFYFSGHGVGTVTGDYLMPTDVPESEAAQKGLPVRTLIANFVKAGLKNVLFIADACRSGKENQFGKELQDLGRKANIAVLLGCAPGQRSYEYPRLEHGVFTHFLVRDLGDRTLTDAASGALWASAVAKQVRTQVREYTEADYGEDAQVPAVWSEPTQDVLLAAYPPAGEGAKAALSAAGIEFAEGKLDQERYARYLSQSGYALAESGRRGEAIEALKTLDGLGLATWADLTHLAGALRQEKRDNEVGSLVARAAREPNPDDWTNFVILDGRPEYVGIKRYREALTMFKRFDSYGFAGATVLATDLRATLHLEYPEIAKELASFSGRFPKDSAEDLYIRAFLAIGDRRFKEAIALSKSALALPKTEDTLQELYSVRFDAANALKDDAEMDAVVAEGRADPEIAHLWASAWMRRLKDRQDPEFNSKVLAYAATLHSVPRLTEVLLALGPDAGLALAEAERVAAENPYSWQAPLNVWLAQAAKDEFKEFEPFPPLAEKYAPNRGDLVRYALNSWDDLLRAGVDSGRVTRKTASRARDWLIGAYADEWNAIKGSPIPVQGFAQMLIQSSQSVRGAYFGGQVLWPFALSQDYARQDLLISSLFLLINGGQDERAREVFATIERDGLLAPMVIVRYATFKALSGDATEAKRAMALWPKLGQGEPNALERTALRTIEALIKVRNGDAKGALALVKDGVFSDLSSALRYLVQYEAGGRKETTPGFLALLMDPDPQYADLVIAARVSAICGFAAIDTPEARRSLMVMSVLLCDYPGHPWAAKVGFNMQSGTAPWAGRTTWAGSISDGTAGTTTTVDGWIDVDKEGYCKGELLVHDRDSKTWTLKGSVDDEGNLLGDISIDGEKAWNMVMKLPTMAFADGPEEPNAPPFRALMLISPTYTFDLRLRLVKSPPKVAKPSGTK